MKRKVFKRISALMIAIILSFSVISQIHAVEGGGSGAGDWGGVASSESTWDDDHQGFRFCITKEDGTPVSNAVDVVYSNSHSLPNASETKFYYTSRTNGNSNNSIYYWTELGFSSNNLNASDTPPAALFWGSGPEGNGLAVNNWMKVEENFRKIMNAQNGGSYVFTFKSSTDQGSLSGSKSVYDVAKSQNYYLTVEPITWLKPSNIENKKPTKVYPYYVYGTINNICKWYYINKNAVNAQLGGANYGGFYSNVLHCLWTSMYIESNAVGLSGTSAAAVLAYNSSNLDEMYTVMQTLGAGLHVYKIRDIGGGADKTVTAVMWYGTKSADGTCTWTKRTEIIDAAKASSYTAMYSSYYNGKVYFHHPIVKYPSGSWSVYNEKGGNNTAAYSSIIPTSASDGPSNALEHNSGTTYYISAKNENEIINTLNAYNDIKAMHFAFIYEESEGSGGTPTPPGGGDGGGGGGAIGYSTLYYPKGMNVITSATVYNDTDKHFAKMFGGSETTPETGSDPATDTRISVSYNANQGGTNWTKTVSQVVVQKGTMQLTWIQWKTPIDLDTMTIEVTPTGGKMKLNGNNYDKIIYTVYLYDPLTEQTPPDPKAEDEKQSFDNGLPTGTVPSAKEWTVQKIERKRIQTGSTPPILRYTYSDGSSSEGESPNPPSGEHTVSATLVTPPQALYTVYYGFFKDTYKVSNFKMKSEITPTPFCPTASKIGATDNWKMKSGYGIYTNVTTEYSLTITTENISFNESSKTWTVTTGSTATDTIKAGDIVGGCAVGFQVVESKFPEFSYKTYNRILKLDTAAHTFHFKPNVFSTLNDTAHYTPLWYPDGKEYRTVSNARYAYTPLGELMINNVKSGNYILIEGNVYDDWHVQAGR